MCFSNYLNFRAKNISFVSRQNFFHVLVKLFELSCQNVCAPKRVRAKTRARQNAFGLKRVRAEMRARQIKINYL